MVSDMMAITSYYNACGYRTKKKNYDIFKDNLRGIKLAVIECAFEDEDYELPDDAADIVLRVRSNSRIWQKERLLNIAIEQLPGQYTKYCSVDCDVIFDDPDWAEKTSRELDSYAVVQPFSEFIRLDREGNEGEHFNDVGISFAKDYIDSPEGSKLFGHVGYAWAYRRDIVPQLYDKMIIGGGDNVMSNIFINRKSWTRHRSTKRHQEDIDRWTEKVYPKVQSQMSYVQGTIRHLWHGERCNRQFSDRQQVLVDLNFDPQTDLKYNEHNCWETTDKLDQAISQYLFSRKEDG